MIKRKESFIFYLISAFVFIAPFVYMKGLYNYTDVPQSAFIQVSIVIILAMFLIVKTLSGDQIRVSRHPMNITVFILLLWLSVSAIYAHNHFESFTLLSNLIACILAFFLVQQLKNQSSSVTILKAIYISGVLVSIIGLCQQLFGLDAIPQASDPASTFANKNMAAQFITLTFPLFLLFKRKKIFASVCSLLMLSFLFFTGCNAAWIAVFFELFLIIFVLNFDFFYRDGRKWCAVLVLIAFALAPVWKTIYNKQSAQQRLEMWENTIDMIKDNPVLGVGLGNYKVFYPKYKKSSKFDDIIFNETIQTKNAHNDILQLTAETGIVGIIIFASILFLFFRSIASVLFNKNDDNFYAALCICVAMSGIVLNACFSFPFQRPIPPLVCMVYLSICLNISRNKRIFFSVPKILSSAFIILLVPGIIGLVQYHSNNIKSNHYYLYMKWFEKNAKWNEVVVLSQMAKNLNPYCKKILSYTARGQIETGDYRKGIENLQEVLKEYPYNTNALTNIGVAYIKSGQYQESLSCFSRILEIKPNDKKALINSAVAYVGLNEYNKAVSIFEKAKMLK